MLEWEEYRPPAGDGPLRVPVVALWGEFDLNVDPQVNRAIFEVALDAARSRDHTSSSCRPPTMSWRPHRRRGMRSPPGRSRRACSNA